MQSRKKIQPSINLKYQLNICNKNFKYSVWNDDILQRISVIDAATQLSVYCRKQHFSKRNYETTGLGPNLQCVCTEVVKDSNFVFAQKLQLVLTVHYIYTPLAQFTDTSIGRNNGRKKVYKYIVHTCRSIVWLDVRLNGSVTTPLNRIITE